MYLRPLLFSLLIALLLTACQSTAPQPAASAAAVAFDGPPADGSTVYQLQPGASQVTIYVYRAGAAARFGHNHVLSTPTLAGWLAMQGDDMHAAQFAVHFRLDQLQIDDAGLRAATGGNFATPRSAADIDGTRKNMLKSLDAERYPEVVIRSVKIAGEWPALVADVVIGLHGTMRTQSIAMKAVHDGSIVKANGRFTLRQSDFGITPFSILGGALAVDDPLLIEFSLQLQAAD